MVIIDKRTKIYKLAKKIYNDIKSQHKALCKSHNVFCRHPNFDDLYPNAKISWVLNAKWVDENCDIKGKTK